MIEVFLILPSLGVLTRCCCRTCACCCEQVRRIATSARHTLVCSSVGSLYSCGDNSDGALGHGDVDACRSLKLVAWFADVSLHGVKGVEGAVEVVEVGAGADLFGSHSAAVDSQGRV